MGAERLFERHLSAHLFRPGLLVVSTDLGWWEALRVEHEDAAVTAARLAGAYDRLVAEQAGAQERYRQEVRAALRSGAPRPDPVDLAVVQAERENALEDACAACLELVSVVDRLGREMNVRRREVADYHRRLYGDARPGTHQFTVAESSGQPLRMLMNVFDEPGNTRTACESFRRTIAGVMPAAGPVAA